MTVGTGLGTRLNIGTRWTVPLTGQYPMRAQQCTSKCYKVHDSTLISATAYTALHMLLPQCARLCTYTAYGGA